MSSSGINATNSGPLIIRTYNNQSSSNKTFILTDFDNPVQNNLVLITSTNGQLVPSDNIYISSISVSSITADNSIISTAYLSSIFSINSTITFNNEVIINNANQTVSGPPSLFIMGPTVITEPGAISTVSTVLNVYGEEVPDPIDQGFLETSSFTIPSSIDRITFQIIGAGGSNSNSNQQVNPNNAGYGGYISADLKVKGGDILLFTIGTVGLGTSLIYISSNVSTLVAIAGSGGENGYASASVSSSSGGGHGGGSNGALTNGNSRGFINGIANGTNGYDGLIVDNNIIKSDTDGGEGAISTLGGLGGNGIGGANGADGGTAIFTNPLFLLTNGGMTFGGAGGVNISTGGTGGGGFSGGGGGGGGTITSAGGGGGASFINFNQLSNELSNVVSLSGQFFFTNKRTAFVQGYGGPNTDGFATVFAYIPNDTIFTNGDIECRVLRYKQLDPPISALGGGTSALWSLHPAIDTVHMQDNSIVECGGIQVDSGGIDVKNYVNIRAGVNDTLGSGFISQFIRTASSGTQTIDYQVANDSTGFGFDTWQDARYVYNSADSISPISQVWGIVTSSNITPVGSTIGDVHFYKSIYIDGKVGIGTNNPSTNLQVVVPDKNAITGISAKSLDVNTIIGAYSNNNYGSIQVTSNNNTNPYVLTLNPIGGDIIIGSTINNLFINSASTNMNELIVQGNEYLTGKLDVTNTALFRNQVSTLEMLTIVSGGANITNEVLVNVPTSDTRSGITISSIESGADSKLSMGFYNNSGQIYPSLQSYRVSDSLAEEIHINPIGGDIFIGQNFTPVITTINGGTIIIGANTTTSIINITATNTSTIGNLNVTQNNTVDGTSLLSGFVTINNSVNVASTLCASTLCTSTLAMTNGQLTGVSSISGDTIYLSSANVSTLGNSIVTGDLVIGGAIDHPDVPPVGAINIYAGSSDPVSGWLICNGRQLNRTIYSSLSSVIGLTFGIGDGTTTFNIPDMQNRFPIGTSINPLGSTGDGTTTLTEANLPSHRHGIIDPGHSHTATHNLRQNNTTTNTDTLVYEKDSGGDPSPMVVTIASNTTGIVSTTNTGSGTPFIVQPAFLSLNYIIKY